MKLEEFIKVMHADVDKFEQYWKTEKEKTPEFFPEEMGEGDWYDQFISFESSDD